MQKIVSGYIFCAFLVDYIMFPDVRVIGDFLSMSKIFKTCGDICKKNRPQESFKIPAVYPKMGRAVRESPSSRDIILALGLNR